MFKKLMPALFVVALTLGFAPALVQAQQPAAAVGGMTYSGSESLTNFGPLTFEFGKDGKVLMSDAGTPQRGKVAGTYTVNGTQVTLRFKDCIYVGQISGQQLSGTARFTEGPNMQSWTFQTQLQANLPQVN